MPAIGRNHERSSRPRDLPWMILTLYQFLPAFPDSVSVSVIPVPVMSDMRSRAKRELIQSRPGRRELTASSGGG
jgi:hypothetical protein